ncbi:ATP-dependent DNA helicase chl1 [Tulasnella sp. 424]|nr:ATP-dependent DNA helicase chl1 [Tulasnella sp. 424]
MTVEETLALSTPDAFPSFPYDPPYAIQLDLMRHLYASIEARKVAILESPTGTGKTLSLLCGAMTWLKDEQARSKKGQLAALEESLKGDGNEPAWVLKQSLELHRRELEAAEEALQERLEAARRKEEALRRKEKGHVRKKQKLTHRTASDDEDDDAFLPDGGPAAAEDDYRHLSADVRELLRKYEARDNPAPIEVPDEEPACTKIFYASRTHTQLSQTISELKKTPFKSNTRTVPLGSRKNLCINEELRSKGGDLDESCRELMSGKGDKRCPYMPPAGEDSRMLDFRDHILATPRDIEDLVVLGKELNTCPYYGSRKAIAQAEKNSREVLGIDLTDQIVVIDEAHNLIDTILSIHTVPLSSSTLRASLSQLKIYLAKFRSRFSPKNALHLRRLVLVLTAIDKFCTDWPSKNHSKGPANEEMLGVQEFVSALGSQVQEINLLEVDQYLRESRIARKISGYCDKVAEKEAAKAESKSKFVSSQRSRGTPPLHAVESFLLALTNPSSDGRIFVSMPNPTTATPGAPPVVLLKYQLLNPADHFRDVVSSARSVVLAGGTMQPISDFETQLFRYLVEGQMNFFGCGHVIPKGNLRCVVVEKGPKGGDMTFRFEQRGNKDLMMELGQLLMNFLNFIPDGVVVFFPSYSFLNAVKKIWEDNGLMAKFGSKKTVFFEPQEGGEVETVLREYAEAIRVSRESASKCSGALLFAVVGAKLSEGLNFTDELARAVILVGLPFANLGSVELKERMKYVTELEKHQESKAKQGARDAGQELYENLCMKAVNQSIGRAIRHRGDWAGLILVDSRYSSPRIRGKLPKWIGEDIVAAKTFGQAMKELGSFYRDKKSGVKG